MLAETRLAISSKNAMLGAQFVALLFLVLAVFLLFSFFLTLVPPDFPNVARATIQRIVDNG